MSHGPGDVPFLDYIINCGIALMGGVVRYLRRLQSNYSEWDKKRLVVEGFVDAITAGFVGLLTFWVLTSWSVSPFYTAFAVGIMGHMGPEGIALLKDVITNGLRSRSAPPQG